MDKLLAQIGIKALVVDALERGDLVPLEDVYEVLTLTKARFFKAEATEVWKRTRSAALEQGAISQMALHSMLIKLADVPDDVPSSDPFYYKGAGPTPKLAPFVKKNAGRIPYQAGSSMYTEEAKNVLLGGDQISRQRLLEIMGCESTDDKRFWGVLRFILRHDLVVFSVTEKGRKWAEKYDIIGDQPIPSEGYHASRAYAKPSAGARA